MKRAFIITKVKDERTFWKKVFGYAPRYSLTITDGSKVLKVNTWEHFYLDWFND